MRVALSFHCYIPFYHSSPPTFTSCSLVALNVANSGSRPHTPCSNGTSVIRRRPCLPGVYGLALGPQLGALVRDFTSKTGAEDQEHVPIHLHTYYTRLPRRLQYACMHKSHLGVACRGAHVTCGCTYTGVSLFAGLDHWTGILDWTTGM